MAKWTQLTLPQGEVIEVNSDQFCSYQEADKGGTWVIFSSGDTKVYRETPAEVKRLIKRNGASDHAQSS